jgi:hypothetical protein
MTEIEDDEMKMISLVSDCIREISRLAPYKEVATLSYTDGVYTLSLPDRFREVVKITYNGTEIKYKDIKEISDFTTEGTPQYYFFTGSNKIGVNPTPDGSYSLTMIYLRGYEVPTREKQELNLLHAVTSGTPPVTTYDSDGCLPVEYHSAISYFIAGLYCDEDEINKVRRFNSEFTSRIQQLILDQTYGYGEYPSTVDVLPKTSHFGDDEWDD